MRRREIVTLTTAIVALCFALLIANAYGAGKVDRCHHEQTIEACE